MAGKTEASVEADGITLSYERWGDRWRLSISDDESEPDHNGDIVSDFTKVSVARKARAFHLLPRLLREIYETQRRSLAAIAAAFQALASVDFDEMEGN